MEELFVPYHIALLAKEKGFNGFQLAGYVEIDNNKFELMLIEQISNIDEAFKLSDNLITTAPTWDQLVSWFRDKHDLHFYIDTTPVFDKTQGSKWKASIKKPFQPFKWTTGHYYLGDTYYQALIKAFEKAFELI